MSTASLLWQSAKVGFARGRGRYGHEAGGWARVVSDVFNPPLVWGVVAWWVAVRGSTSAGAAFGWAALYWLLVCIAPVLYIAYGVRRGHITDMHLAVRTQRFKPFIVSMLGALVAFVLLSVLPAPPLLATFALFSLTQIAVMLAITLRWQISMHTMSAAGAVVMLGGLFGVPTAFAVAPLIAVVGAARVRLNRHNPAQVIAGGLLGTVLTAGMYVVSGAAAF